MHTLTYVLSIEIALTVTVLCREASREKIGYSEGEIPGRVKDLGRSWNKGAGWLWASERAGRAGRQQADQTA